MRATTSRTTDSGNLPALPGWHAGRMSGKIHDVWQGIGPITACTGFSMIDLMYGAEELGQGLLPVDRRERRQVARVVVDGFLRWAEDTMRRNPGRGPPT